MYKQRHKNPNRKDTAGANYAHIRYIATRPRVLRNEGMDHGLFGKMHPGPVELFHDWGQVARQVYANSRKGITMYRGIVSFHEDTAGELLLKDQGSWQRYMENHITTIAGKNGIRREHLQWACAVHGEGGHPHVHVVFWDTSVKVRNPYVPPAIPNAIRVQMIKDTFHVRIKEYCRGKEAGETGMRSITDRMVADYERHLRRLVPGQYRELADGMERELDEGLFLPDKDLSVFGTALLGLRGMMPAEGRISYQLLPPDVKAGTDRMVALAIDLFPDLKEAVEAYVDARASMASLYLDDVPGKRGLYEKEAHRIIANRILSGVRMVIRMEGEMRSRQYLMDRRDHYAEEIILGCLSILSGPAKDAEGAPGPLEGGRGELSREARREMYLKMQDKGYEH